MKWNGRNEIYKLHDDVIKYGQDPDFELLG
jgi:hypothetical protein